MCDDREFLRRFRRIGRAFVRFPLPVAAFLVVAIPASVALAGCGGGGGEPGTTVVETVTLPTTTIVSTDKTGTDPIPPPGPATIVADRTDSGPPQFKSCHGMSTRATLYIKEINPPRVIGTTNIWSHCWFGGFTGTAAVVVGDADGNALTWTLPVESWGVNGESEAAAGGGSNDRIVHWQASVEDPSVLPLARTLQIEHTWAPRNRLVSILEQAVSAGKSLAAVAASVEGLGASR
jgi:hypothetical protein